MAIGGEDGGIHRRVQRGQAQNVGRIFPQREEAVVGFELHSSRRIGSLHGEVNRIGCVQLRNTDYQSKGSRAYLLHQISSRLV